MEGKGRRVPPCYVGGAWVMVLTAGSLHFSEGSEDMRTDISLASVIVALAALRYVKGLKFPAFGPLISAAVVLNLSMMQVLALPFVANHIWVWLLGMYVIAVCHGAEGYGKWILVAARPCAMIAGAAYFWAGFHKFNQDFLDAKHSCLENFRGRWLGLLPPQLGFVTQYLHSAPPEWLFTITALGVISLEVSAGLLMFVPLIRARRLGFILGLTLLHMPTAIIIFYDFGAVALAMGYLTLGVRSAVPHRWFPGAESRAVNFCIATCSVGLVFRVVTMFDPTLTNKRLRQNYLPRLIQFVRGLVAIAFATPLVKDNIKATLFPTEEQKEEDRREDEERAKEWNQAPRIVRWASRLGVAYAILHGMAPYIGGGTASAFTMFSNLRVDEKGHTNHLLVRNTFDTFGLQGDIVEWKPVGRPGRYLDPRDPKGAPELSSGMGRIGTAPLTLVRSHMARARLGGFPVGALNFRKYNDTKWDTALEPEQDPHYGASTLPSWILLFRRFPVDRGCLW
eukprot:Hpha_TRINITY_DN13471_c0_g2::TRINITY_DN13471_c0_g2_i1::g.130933::m.130933